MKQFLKGFFVGIGFLLFFIFGLFMTKAFDLFIAQNKSSIIQEVQVSKLVDYDEFVSFPRFSASKALSTADELSADELKSIEKSYEAVLLRVKQEKLCTGGSYVLEPNYSYKDGLAVPSGYRFSASFECRFAKSKSAEYKTLLDEIASLLQDNRYIVLTIPSITPTLSDTALQKAQLALYDEALDAASKLSEQYSAKLSKDCKVANVLFDQNAYLRMANSSQTPYDMPIVAAKNHKLKASVTFECR